MKSNVDLNKVFQEKLNLLQSAQEKNDAVPCKDIIELLLDNNSFVEMYSLLSNENKTSGITTGFGTVDNRPVYVIFQDQSLNHGAVSELQSKKFTQIIDSALQSGVPLVLLLNSNGAFIEDGAKAMHAYSDMYNSLSKISGVCPTICIVNGKCYGDNAILSQLCDFVISVDNESQISLSGPQVLSANEGPETNTDEIIKHINDNNKVLTCHVSKSLQEAFDYAKDILSYLPDNNESLSEYLPDSNMNKLVNFSSETQNIDIVKSICDSDTFVSIYQGIDEATSISLTRIGGHTVLLIVINDSIKDIIAYQKISKFISIADSFNIPIVSFVNANGTETYNISKQAWAVQAQANMVYNYSCANVPKISIVYGNAIGNVCSTIASKSLNDIVYSFPESVISALNPSSAIQVAWPEKIKSSTTEIENAKDELVQKYIDECASSIVAAKNGLVDDIIDPKYTRMYIVYALEMLETKKSLQYSKKHGNLPL